MSTCFLARDVSLFQQLVDDACSVDGMKQDLKVAQSAEDDSATVPLHHQFEIPVGCKDVEMYSLLASPHDRNVMLSPESDVMKPSGTAKLAHFEISTSSEVWSKILIRWVTWH